MIITNTPTKYHRFAFEYSWNPEALEFCRQLKTEEGFQRFSYAPEIKKWVFSNTMIVDRITKKFPSCRMENTVAKIYAEDQKRKEKAGEMQEKVDEIKASSVSGITIDGLKLPLYEYQKIGVEFLMACSGRGILADAPGVGKSAQALAYIKKREYQKVLVVCPASVKYAWEKEIEKWTDLPCVLIDGKTNLSSVDPKARIWVVNYDVLFKHREKLAKVGFDLIIGDEAQYVKSTSARRTKVFRTLSRTSPRIVLLSGTPLLSRPAELFSLLNIVDPQTWDSWTDYSNRYCNAHMSRWGWDTKGASNIEELHARIRRYFIRRQKSEVLKELPPKIFIDVPVHLSPELADEYSKAESAFGEYLATHQGKMPSEVAQSMAAQKLVQLNVLRQINSRGKVSAAIETIENTLDSGEKIVVFSTFNEPLESIKEHFGDAAVMITGKTPQHVRGDIVTDFQSNPEKKIFLGGTLSAGTGITLTAASNVLFLDYSWNPADMIQASDRIHRPGQEASSCNIYQLYVPSSVDEDMKETLDYKQSIIDRVIDGKEAENAGISAVERALQRIKERSIDKK